MANGHAEVVSLSLSNWLGILGIAGALIWVGMYWQERVVKVEGAASVAIDGVRSNRDDISQMRRDFQEGMKEIVEAIKDENRSQR